MALIANVHPDGDGLWFWYATAVLHGSKLYTDLHLNLQPLFVLITALFLRLLGPGWLAFKVVSALQALAYCTGLLLLVRKVRVRSWERGLLLTAVFGLTLTSPPYRFDDYHVTTQIFQVYALGLLLRLADGNVRRASWLAACLGLLCGLSLSNRLNDGAALFAACFCAVPLLLRTRRVPALLLLTVSTVATLLGVVLLTGDTVAAWHLESITRAARIKGGTGTILVAPLLLPWRLLHSALGPVNSVLIVVMAGLVFALRRFPRWPGSDVQEKKKYRLMSGAIVLVSLLWLVPGVRGKSNIAVALALFVMGIWIYLRVAGYVWKRQWNGKPELLLVPFWGLVSASLTAGVMLPDYPPNAAIFLLVLPLAFASVATVRWQRRGLLLVCWLIVIAFLPAKTVVPYQWHHYHADPLFLNRTVYRHPDFGPMLLEKNQLAFMQPMCAAIRSEGPDPTLLALSYPYPNYFCDVPPWHGYVQTWYDTSSKDEIDALDGELLHAPPQWIMYQRGLDTIALHEAALMTHPVMPQRALDRELMQEIAQNKWTIIRRECFEGSDWILIRTRSPQAGEHHGSASDADDRYQACLATESDFWTRHKLLRRH